MTHIFSIFADYFQFILMDENSQTDFSTIWTAEALDKTLASTETAICPVTFRNIDVTVEIEILNSPPIINLADWDNAVEASITIPSGKLIVMGCTDYIPDAPRIDIQPATYHCISLAKGLDTIKTEWESANDLYRVCLWPGSYRTPQILKKYNHLNT